MKFNAQKLAGGVIAAVSDIDAEKLTKLKSFEIYEFSVKRTRNPQFHKKVFALFNFSFHYWKSDREFMDEAGQFDVFRAQLTVMAGYYDAYYKLDGSTRVEAKSLSYGNMSQQEFEAFYSALINTVIDKVFQDCDKETEDRLMGFL